jgi:hypothetical protein
VSKLAARDLGGNGSARILLFMFNALISDGDKRKRGMTGGGKRTIALKYAVWRSVIFNVAPNIPSY